MYIAKSNSQINQVKKGILLFDTSTRKYGHDIYSFFADLKEHRTEMIMKVGDFAIPEITIAK
jgi:hypothetical protein